MRSAIHNITFDCHDPYAVATFWSQVFDRPLHDDDHPGDPEAVVLLGDGLPNLLFQAVPEPKQTKNRVHLDLQPDHRATTRSTDSSGSAPRGWRIGDDPTGPGGPRSPTPRGTSCASSAAPRNAASPAADVGLGSADDRELLRRHLGRDDVDHHARALLEPRHAREPGQQVHVPVVRTGVAVRRGVEHQVVRHVSHAWPAAWPARLAWPGRPRPRRAARRR